MLACKKCNQNLISVGEFLEHIKYSHPGIIQVTCPFPQCSRFYSNRTSLRAHINNSKMHCPVSVAETSVSLKPSVMPSKKESVIVAQNKTENQNENTTNIISNLKLEMIKHAVDLLSDELISRKKSFDVLKKSFEYYSKAFLSLQKCEGTYETDNFKEFCEYFADPSSTQSEYKLKKALKTAGVYIAAEDHVISCENELKYVNGVPKLYKDIRIVKIFNVTDFLEKFLNLPGIMCEIDTFIKSKQKCEDGSISNIVQTPLWKKLLSVEEKCDSIIYLPLNVYFDDFEPQNVIGSHSGAYKIGSVYMGIPCLPNHIISKLEFTFPVCLFFSEDRKDYGNKKVFAPVIKILNDLYSAGVNVKYGKVHTVRFIVTLILGDNLGLSDILGFTGFNANYYCRFCKVKKYVMKTQLVEDFRLLRNYKNYSEDVGKGITLTGISEECVFHYLKKFHVTRNFSVDILHDFFEGVCHYDLCNIIINLINKNYFTLDELNSNVKYHDYGPFIKNKKIDPITVDDLEKTKLRTSGEEMKVLLINFGLIIGHRVDHDCPEWHLYIVLRQILSIVTSKTIHCRTYELLESLVSEHHELYLQCFQDTLKPKHHFMVHYARILHMVGPTGLISSMRYESYHKKFKNVANVISCRKSLLTTFATKIEYQIANFFFNFKGLQNTPVFGRMSKVDAYPLFRKYNFSSDSKEVELSSWVEVGAVLIKRNCIIQTGLEMDDSPKFGLVEEIINFDKSVVLLGCKKIENLGFDLHFYAYSVVETTDYFIFPAENVDVVSYMLQGSENKKLVFLK